MDKIFSARLDESIVLSIQSLAQKLKTTKKDVVESAIRLMESQVDQSGHDDVFAQTAGAWKRKEGASELVKQARQQFDEAYRRYQ